MPGMALMRTNLKSSFLTPKYLHDCKLFDENWQYGSNPSNLYRIYKIFLAAFQQFLPTKTLYDIKNVKATKLRVLRSRTIF